jgi:hypothetical protein
MPPKPRSGGELARHSVAATRRSDMIAEYHRGLAHTAKLQPPLRGGHLESANSKRKQGKHLPFPHWRYGLVWQATQFSERHRETGNRVPFLVSVWCR